MSSPARTQSENAKLAIHRDSDADLTTYKDIDFGAATLYAAFLINTTNVLTYASFWDSIAGTVAGGGEVMRLMCPANGGAGIALGLYTFAEGMRFDEGITALGHTALDGTGDPGASAFIIGLVTSAGLVYPNLTEEDPAASALTGGTYPSSYKTALGTQLYEDPSSIDTSRQAGSGAQTFYGAYVDNSLNTGAHAYLKLYDAAAPTIGSDEPSIIFRAYKGRKCRFSANSVSAAGVLSGISFATALSRVTTGSGGVGGSSLASTVPIKLLA